MASNSGKQLSQARSTAGGYFASFLRKTLWSVRVKIEKIRFAAAVTRIHRIEKTLKILP